MMTSMVDVAVIGCGIVGAATAYELSRYDLSVTVLEAANDVADGTTKANSAILHAGYDPHPGTRMAALNVEGARLAKELCAKLQVSYKQIGSLVLAFDEEDLVLVRELYHRGATNGVPGLQLLDAAGAHMLEPGLSDAVVGALYAPSAAIVNPWEYALALAETAVRNGVQMRCRSEVTAIRKIEGGYELQTASGPCRARRIVNAAGIRAAAVHDMIAPHAFSIHCARGEYYLLDKGEGSRVGHVIFQCPNRDGKGVLVAPTVHGNLIVGPNADENSGESVANTASGLAYVAKMAHKSVPTVDLRASIRNFAGVRALSDQEDFIIQEAKSAPGFIDLAGIKSPGLTAAPAIAREAVALLEQSGLALKPKAYFIDTREHLCFKDLSAQEKQELIEREPAYGRVICRCETITEGEILAAIHSSIPPCSIDGVMRRCNAGMGRCQGGFCGPRVAALLMREQKLSPTQLLQDKDGSFVLTGQTKLEGN